MGFNSNLQRELRHLQHRLGVSSTSTADLVWSRVSILRGVSTGTIKITASVSDPSAIRAHCLCPAQKGISAFKKPFLDVFLPIGFFFFLKIKQALSYKFKCYLVDSKGPALESRLVLVITCPFLERSSRKKQANPEKAMIDIVVPNSAIVPPISVTESFWVSIYLNYLCFR